MIIQKCACQKSYTSIIMTSITWAGPRYVQELGTFSGSQNRTQRGCVLQSVPTFSKHSELYETVMCLQSASHLLASHGTDTYNSFCWIQIKSTANIIDLVTNWCGHKKTVANIPASCSYDGCHNLGTMRHVLIAPVASLAAPGAAATQTSRKLREN